jgi:hypothetical protein
MNKAIRAKDLKFFASGFRGKFLCYKTVNTQHGMTKTFTFQTPEGEVTIWNNHRLDAPLSKLKRDDEVVIIWNGTETLSNGHTVEEYAVYKLME